jgi:hypothetical protein
MLNVQIDEQAAREIYLEKLEEKLKDFDAELVFWDSKELCRRTCMSWNFIQEQFFFDPRFPKKKVRSKWLFPARETREFLIKWLNEQ